MITGAVINTELYQEIIIVLTVLFKKYGLALRTVRGIWGTSNGVEIQFNILGDLKGINGLPAQKETLLKHETVFHLIQGLIELMGYSW